MSKADQIREALREKERSAPELKKIVSGFNSSTLYGMVDRGEVDVVGEGRKHTYRLNPDYQPGSRLARPQRRKKSPRRGGKAKRASKRLTLKDVARRALNAPKPNGNGVTALAFENYRAASAQLRHALEAEVAGIENNATLHAAVQNHIRAEKLLEAAGA